jgi:DNA mismatch endonuclease, patch repair protein
MDKLNKEKRCWNMSRIRAKDTGPELLVRSMLHKAGYRFRKHVSYLPGTPDIVLPKHRTIIFINGCFWHGHENCKDFAPPKTRTQWWVDKINRTKELDAENIKKLEKHGWRVFILWECELNKTKLEKTIGFMINELKK